MRTVLMVASEGLPFAKASGIADVIGALPAALMRIGWHVTVVMPRYAHRGAFYEEAVETARQEIHLGDRRYRVGFGECLSPSGVRTILVDCPELYSYPLGVGDSSSDPTGCGVLGLAALEFAARYGPPPAVLHAHNWQAALAPVYLRLHPAVRSPLEATSSIFTIHDLSYQGRFDLGWLTRLELPAGYSDIEEFGSVNLVKAAVATADVITTVSPSYAEAIQTPGQGFGLDEELRRRGSDIVGILNAIDTAEWDPATDRFLPQPFCPDDLVGKRAAKRELLSAYGIAVDEVAMARPVFGMVSRLVSQKGFGLLAVAARELAGADVTLMILGTGDAEYETFWRQMADDHPQHVAVHIGFDERRAHLIHAGSDAYLMPSLFEPCGLQQMYSMRYGTIPIVRAVGGLADSVDSTVGFSFMEPSPDALISAVREAVRVYRQEPERWTAMMLRAMTRDFSWDHAARLYASAYERAIWKHSAPRGAES